MSCGRILLLIATSTQLTTAAPISSAKEYFDNPASYQDYLTFQEPYSKRAPWAPSIPRSDMFSQKVWEVISERNKGKRSKELEQPIEQEDTSAEIYMNLLELLQTEDQGFNGDSIRVTLKKLNDRVKADQRDEPSKSSVDVRELHSRGEPALYQVEGTDGPKQVFELYDDPKTKRSSSPFYLGLGQHAANAAMSAYENILDESKNYKPERPSNPVRFLGKR